MNVTSATCGWRLFSLDSRYADRTADSPWLLSPFAAAGLLGNVEDFVWREATMTARCSSGHRAPDGGCTCGIRATTDLRELLAHAQRPIPPSGRPLLELAPVLALVDFPDARVQPGTDMPADDPHTTVRVSVATIRELHLRDDASAVPHTLSTAYQVPVRVWPADDWPHGVRSLDPWFVELLRQHGMGNKDLTGDVSALVDLAKHAAHGIATRALMRGDVATAMFDSKARPTWAQAQAFVSAALQVYAPHAAQMGDQFSVSRPVTLGEVMTRSVLAQLR